MSRRTLLLGVDAGGTKTRVVLAEAGSAAGAAASAPRIAAEVVGAAGDLPALGTEGMIDRLRAWVGEALRGAGRAVGGSGSEIAVATLGLPGWGLRDAWDDAWTDVVRSALPRTRLVLLNDVALAREGAFVSEPGILALAGTGSMACGRSAGGPLVTSGGWGFAFGDEGSGYDLGREGLRAAARASDGRGPATILVERLPAVWGVATLEHVVDWLMDDVAHLRARTAAAAPVVLQAAADGDEVAKGLVAWAARSVAEQADAVRRAIGEADMPLSTAGGLFESVVYRDAFAASGARFGLPVARTPLESAREAAIRLAHEVSGSQWDGDTPRVHRGFRVVDPSV